MALKLFSFDNAPQGPNYLVNTGYAANTFNTFTGQPGTPILYPAAGDSGIITSDGFFTLTAGGGANLGMHTLKFSDVRGATITQSWFGMRHKATVAKMTGPLLRIFNAFGGTVAASLAWSELVAAGGGALGVEDYIELFVDTNLQTFQYWYNGVMIKSGGLAISIPTGGVGPILYIGPYGGTNVTGAFGIRDMYWMDIDSVDTARLGPIRSALATTVITGSEYVVTGAASLQAALTTALQNPPTATPNALSPADKQPLTVALSTALAATTPIVAVQGQISVAGNASAASGIDLSLTNGGNTADLGIVALPDATMLYNRYAPNIARTAPDGTAWSVAKINATTLLATPQ